MNVTLLEPETPKPAGLDTYAVAMAWDGGQWDASVPYGDGTVHLSPPRPPSTFDLEVLGLSGGQVTWRGITRGVSPENLQPSLLFGKVGAFSSFSSTPWDGGALAGSTASPMGLGQVLVVGGSNAAYVAQLAWVYDQSTASFSTSPPPAQAFAHHLALPLLLTDRAGDSEWLLAGGEDTQGGFATAHTEIYSRHYGSGTPESGTFATLAVPQRSPAGAWADSSGNVSAVGCGITPDGDAGLSLIAGAVSEPLPPFLSCGGGQVAFVPDAGLVIMGFDGGVWLATPDGGALWITSLDVSRGFRSAVGLGGLVVLGGETASGVTNEVRRVYPDFDAGSLQVARSDFAVVVLEGGMALVVGGRGADGGALQSAELLNLATLAAPNLDGGQTLFMMQTARIAPAVSEIPGYGAALVVSGEDETGPAGGFEVFTYP
jgi:hypothetical protein